MDFKKEIAQKITGLIDMEFDKVMEMIEIPPQGNMGDYAFPCFQLAKVMRKAPNMIAADLAAKVESDHIVSKAQGAGGYLNFFVNKTEYIKAVIGEVLAKENQFGSSDMGQGKKVLVEFSSPNIAKSFHIGHACTTLIGSAIEKIYRHLGYETVRLNHLGDWGTQFGKLISAYKRWADEEALQKEPIKELLRIYVKFHEEAEKDPSLVDEGRAYFKKLEDNDPEAMALWKKFRELSLIEFSKIYNILNIEFDSYAGESFYQDKMGEVVELLDEKGLLKESNGAKVVELDHLNIPPCIILKSDGATIYATRDLAAALYRKRTYDFHKCIYVVGSEQILHFKQVFAVLDLMGYEWAKDMKHIYFGMVGFPGRKLSTRKGDMITLEELIDEAISQTQEIIQAKNPNLENKEEVAKKVGIGAMIYTFLKNNRERDITFTWEDTLSFEGDSGPYVQYTYVRGKSILRRAGELPATADYSHLQTEDEFNLVKLMGAFKDSVKEAAERYEPFVVTRHVTELAKAYNKFYNTHPILNAEENIKNARLHLTKAVCDVIKTGLGLVGIETPENM